MDRKRETLFFLVTVWLLEGGAAVASTVRSIERK